MHLEALRFQPLLPVPLLWALGLLSLVVIVVSLWRRAGGGLWRALAIALALAWLCGPMLMRESWRGLPETLLLVEDRTASMQVGKRAAMAREAADRVASEAARLPGISVRRVEVSPGAGEAASGGTRLIGAIQRATASIPGGDAGRIAGIVAITDGEVNDAPAVPPKHLPGLAADVPLHVLIPAAGEETDRRLRVLQAPPFGIVGQSVTLRVEIDDTGPQAAPAGSTARLSLTRNGEAPIARDVTVGRPEDIVVPVDRPGPMLLALEAATLPGEVSTLNNRTVVQVNGVRDRLKVLLISGTPNQGERVWRRLLKADPSVDLVHFTILRPPEKDDSTPLSDLALIAFPTRELFQEKINQFDLIILDGFSNRGILPLGYLRNIADFVRGGGGLLLTAGPEFLGPGSLQDTPLGDVLPAHVPDEGGLIEQRFQPMPTALGRRHPVTAGLPETPPEAPSSSSGSGGGSTAGWGSWYRALKPDQPPASGAETLLTGPDGSPLLLLDKVDDGRVAMLLSDQLWLWSRGEEGGGPQPELLRRLAHWLMKEPELEEEQLNARIENGRLNVTRRSVAEAPAGQVRVTAPDGARSVLALRTDGPGSAAGSQPASADGIWSVSDGHEHAYAAAQPADPLEIAELAATAGKLRPLVDRSGGGIVWLGADAARPDVPALRRVGPHGAAAGPGWIGLRRHGAHVVTGEQAVPLLPAWAVLPLCLLLLLLAWRREGRA